MIDCREDTKWTVYIHIVPKELSGYDWDKYYVGITGQKPEQRWRNGKGYIGQVFYNAVQKYGWKNMQHDIIAENLTQNEAENFECIIIKTLNSNNNSYGYNIDSGGNVGKVLSEETKRKLSLSQPKFFGKENKNHVSVICLNDLTVFDSIADANEWLGFKRNCSLISNVLNGTSDSLTIGKHPITKERCVWAYYDKNKTYHITKPPKKNIAQSKKVICLETKEVFDSSASAAKHLKLNRSSIGECCRGQRDKCGMKIFKNGYHFKFYQNYLKENNLTEEEAHKSLFFVE